MALDSHSSPPPIIIINIVDVYNTLIFFCVLNVKYAAFAEVPELLQYMKKNYQFWKDQEASGVTGLPAEYTIPQTPTDLVRKIEFETLAECKETLDS